MSPLTSPLTLIGVIKGPKNRGIEIKAEIEKDEGDNREVEQLQFDSAIPKHP